MLSKSTSHLMRLSFVPRWIVVPTIRKQNVAEHSFRVAVLCEDLVRKHEWSGDRAFKLRVLGLALRHDIDEVMTGDLPSQSKGTRKDPSLLNPEQLVVKIADVIEALVFTYEEIGMGNRSMLPIRDDLINVLDQYWDHFPWESTNAKPSLGQLVQDIFMSSDVSNHPLLQQ